MYKSIMIGNHERTREVIRNAMMKHGLEGSPDSYTLSQILPDKGTYEYKNAHNDIVKRKVVAVRKLNHSLSFFKSCITARVFEIF